MPSAAGNALPSRPSSRRRAAALVAVTSAASATTVVAAAEPASASVSFINSVRASAGKAPLIAHGGLAGIATRHAQRMAASGTLAHSSGLGGAVGSVLPGYTRAAENVGVGGSVDAVNRSFMQSSSHRANILGDFTHAGVGVATSADGRVWVTQVFAKVPGTVSAAGSATSGAPRTSSAVPRARTPVATRPARAGRAAPASPGGSRAGTPARDLAPADNPLDDVVGGALAPGGTGYLLAGADGAVFALGGASFAGSMADTPLAAPAVGLATSGNAGYWLATAEGGVFALGGAPFHGSMAGHQLNGDVVDIDRSGSGYLLAGEDGGVFSFGAPFHGSMAGRSLNAPVVGAASTPSGNGYLLAAADGGVFAFGDAVYAGGIAGQDAAAPVVDVVSAPGGGYWLVSADGGVFAFGGAPFLGSVAGQRLGGEIQTLVPTATGQGYWLVGRDGGVFSFGDAEFGGTAPAERDSWEPPEG